MPTRLVAGCMTGTSLDALDVALVEITGAGLELRAAPRGFHSAPLGDLAAPLRALADGSPCSAGEIAHLAQAFALLHVKALRVLLGAARPDLIVVHGQTVFHDPPASWQLLCPTPIALALRAPVVFDLRAADLALGGQGAPITPLADLLLFHHPSERRAIVNLGGYCNVTWLPACATPNAAALAAVRGGDVCACNQLLDALARSLLGRPFDGEGAAAAGGQIHAPAFDDLLARLGQQASAGRSLGAGDDLADWITGWRGQAPPADILRTACEAVGRTIGERVRDVERVALAGGSTRNGPLRVAITRHAGVPVGLTDDFGVPMLQREAIGMAVLGALCQDRVPITLPQVTHVPPPAPVAGCWVYP